MSFVKTKNLNHSLDSFFIFDNSNAKNMRNYTLCSFILFLIFSSSLNSQNMPGNENRFSVEMGMGLHVPLLPSKQIDRVKYINFNHFQIASRYMITHNFGARLKYAYDRFQHANISSEGVQYNRIGVDGIFNLRGIFNFLNNSENFGILAHGGGSITFSSVLQNNEKDKMINVSFGVTPLFKISENISLFGEGTFVVSTFQDNHFTGQSLDELGLTNKSVFGTASLGLIFYLGNKSGGHVDWN